MSHLIHVARSGSDSAAGTVDQPLRTISHAARRAMPGDVVRVHEGVYREWVKPSRGGTSDLRRITFEAAPGERVTITGAEQVSEWEFVNGTVWKASVDNSVFGDFNPFAEEIDGDWIDYGEADSPKKHLGDVYLNGVSFYEVSSVADVGDPHRRSEVLDGWTGVADRIRNPDQTLLVWFAEVAEHATTIWANFQGADPTAERVEINVRRSVFFPVEHHVDFITVRGFELCQAASPWSPPTADQPGLIGPNWAKGWIIEDNTIHDAKCSAISLGKERSTGHNFATERMDKPGYQYQLEAVFAAREIGWDREHIGSHIIRRNTIFDCGQNAIVGHLGAVFSTIEDNHIHHIAMKREFFGYEIAGIKLHAAIDTEILHNRIHDCTLGIWLDWQTQGTRLSRNVLHDNNLDTFIEVSHGPYLVDHNVFGSRASVEVFSQGGAFINNLVCGTVSIQPVLERPTPYHLAHSTHVAGYAAILGGDDRYVGNIFLGGDSSGVYSSSRHAEQTIGYGTSAYDGHPPTFDEFHAMIVASPLIDHERFQGIKQPVFIRENTYAPGVNGYRDERNSAHLVGDLRFHIISEGDAVFLEAYLPAEFDTSRVGVTRGVDLPPVRIVGAHFENRDGTTVRLDVDLIGDLKTHGQVYPAGPLARLTAGESRTRIW